MKSIKYEILGQIYDQANDKIYLIINDQIIKCIWLELWDVINSSIIIRDQIIENIK